FPHYYLTLPAGPPTQGDIWTNLPFPTLNPPTAVALVVTPRCDFAHEKTPVFNYLPAVALDTYIEDALPRLLEREFLRLNNQVKNFDIPLRAYALLEIGVPPEGIVDQLEAEARRGSSSARGITRAVQQFRENVDKMLSIRQFLASPVRDTTL